MLLAFSKASNTKLEENKGEEEGTMTYID